MSPTVNEATWELLATRSLDDLTSGAGLASTLLLLWFLGARVLLEAAGLPAPDERRLMLDVGTVPLLGVFVVIVVARVVVVR